MAVAFYTFREGISSATVFGKDGVVYFFLFDQLDKAYEHDEIPKYSDDDAERFAESMADFPTQPEKEFAGKVIFRDLWQSRKSSALVATEEPQCEKWTFGRIALLGDSVHKGTPNAGPGGNGGIESAAVFANFLYRLRHQGYPPSRDQIIAALTEYENKRKHRANEYVDSARFFTDLNSLATWPHRLATWYMSDMWENASVEFRSDQCQNAPKINYLPTPERSLQGWMPFNEEQGVGMKEPMGPRVLRAVLFILLPLWTLQKAFSLLEPPPPMKAGDLGRVMPQLDFSVILTIMLIESSPRLANSWTLAAFPTLVLLLGQLFGMNIVMPLYYAVHYAISPTQLFRSSEICLTDRRYSGTAFLAIILGYVSPYFCSWIGLLVAYEKPANLANIKMVVPLLVAIVWHILARFRNDTWRADRSTDPHVDFEELRNAVICTFPIPLAFYGLWVTIASLSTPIEWFYYPLLRLLGLARSDYSNALFGALFWLALLRYDTVIAGMDLSHWFTDAAIFVLFSILLRPGVTARIMWINRETSLRWGRHRGAITKDDHEEFKKRCAAVNAQQTSKDMEIH